MRRALLTRFRVKPDPARPEHFEVLVFATKAAMCAHYANGCSLDEIQWRKGFGLGDFDFTAITIGWTRIKIQPDGTETVHPNIGQILFHHENDRIGAELVSHEMSHAVLMWFEHGGHPWDSLVPGHDWNEAVCLAQGRMVGQFWRKWYRWQDRHAQKKGEHTI